MNIQEIIPQQDFTLFVRADNGQTGMFDVRPYLKYEAFRPLEKQEEFFNIHNGGYFIEWQAGADLSADTIFAKWQKHEESAQAFSAKDTLRAAHP